MPIPITLKDFYYSFHKTGGQTLTFELSDEKVNAGDGQITYYGYLAYNGAWVIMESNLDNGTYRYLVGRDNYAANWAVRESATYVLYSVLNLSSE